MRSPTSRSNPRPSLATRPTPTPSTTARWTPSTPSRRATCRDRVGGRFCDETDSGRRSLIRTPGSDRGRRSTREYRSPRDEPAMKSLRQRTRRNARRHGAVGSALTVRVYTYAPTVFTHCQHCEVAFGEVGIGAAVRREEAANALPHDLATEFARLS